MKLSSEFPSRITFSSKIEGYLTVTLNVKKELNFFGFYLKTS